MKPGDTWVKSFPTYSPTTAASADADSLPTAKVRRNGVDDLDVTVTVTRLALGDYTFAATIPGTYAINDRWEVLVDARVEGVRAFAVAESVVLRSGLDPGNKVTLTFQDENNTAVPLVPFKILPIGAVGQAGTDGISAFGLADGTYTVVGIATGNVLFPETTLTVSGTTTLTVQGQGHTIMPPVEPGVCAIEWTAYSSGSTMPKDGVNYYARYLSGPAGTSVDGREMVFTSVGTEALNTRMECFQGFEMEIRRGLNGPRRKFIVPSRTTGYMTDSDVLGVDLIGPDT